MRRTNIKQRVAILTLALLLAPVSGCDLLDLLSHPLLALGLGTLVASQFETVTVDRQCFLNGEEVDCSDLSVSVEQ